MPNEYVFAKWVPQEIQEQARSIGATPMTSGGACNYPLIAKILSAYDQGISLAAKAFFRDFKDKQNWIEHFVDFLIELSQIPPPTPSPSTRLTPTEAHERVNHAINIAGQLANIIEGNPDLFLRTSLCSLPIDEVQANPPDCSIVEILRAFAQSTADDLTFSAGDNGGPRLGRCDGSRAELNDYLRMCSIAAQRNLGEVYPIFCSTVISVILGRRVPPNTYASHALQIIDSD